ncbi:MAG: hypothetical protein KKG99_09345 [Bacteroidetes bacterium]|nr:hypothetical protein [Bacteroidota bacterium]
MKVFYFIKYFENGFNAYFEKINNCIATFTFDLEDSIHDFNDQNRSRLLKEKYREILKNVLNQNLNIHHYHSIAIRINNPLIKEFSKDIKLLKEINGIHWDTIIIPKVENINQIKITLLELKKNQVKFQNIAIFIETKNGMSALKEIIFNNIPELKYVIFGHADYNLDNRIFPFIHQSESQYWSWVEKMFIDLVDSNIIFINSPCLFLDDNDLFNFNLKKLSDIFKVRFGQMTLTLRQTSMCNNFKERDFGSLKYPYIKSVDKVEFALELIKEDSMKKSDKSFSINGYNNFICPQEVVMARLFLGY